MSFYIYTYSGVAIYFPGHPIHRGSWICFLCTWLYVWWFCILYSTASYSLFLAWWVWRSFHLSLFSIGVLVAASPSACSRFRQSYSLSDPGVEQGWHLELTPLEAFTWCQCPWDTRKHYWGKFSIGLHLHTVCTLGSVAWGRDTSMSHDCPSFPRFYVWILL